MTTCSPEQECGNCHGVEYCTSDSQCNQPPLCFEPEGQCLNGVCSYPTPATTCPAGTCNANHECIQNCADDDCAQCTTEAVGGCAACGTLSLVDGCCAQGCIELTGGSFSGTYLESGTYNGSPRYYSASRNRWILMYCCGWGWAVTNVNGDSSNPSVYYKTDDTTGTAGAPLCPGHQPLL